MIDRDDLLELVDVNDIVEILNIMGSDDPKKDSQGNLYFQTICHGGDKHKLHFFKESKMFMCYTSCGSMSLYDVLMNCNGWSFNGAFKYLAKYKGVSLNNKEQKVGLVVSQKGNTDLEFLKKHLYKPSKNKIKLPKYNKDILKIFDNYYPQEWFNEGICEEVANFFQVKFYFNQYKAVIPHYDINGELVGIRSRNFFKSQIEDGKKYMPITIQGLTYRYPMNFNLYGIYQNKKNIQRIKKAIIFESEKSVLKYGSYYGQENNIALASSGMNMSLYQRDLLLRLGINEVIIAYDKQYQLEYINEDNKQSREYREYIMYVKKLTKISKMFLNSCDVSIICCWDNRIDYKDAPIDKGIETFESLMKDRYYVNDLVELEDLISEV